MDFNILEVLQGLFIFTVLVFLLYTTYLNYTTSLYWKNRNIPYFPAKSLFNPNAIASLLLTHSQLKEIYYSSNSPCVGFFQFRKPTLLLKSPQAINAVLNTDFKYFLDKRAKECTEGKTDPLTQHLIALGGYKWKYLRSKLTPSFTPDKLRNMFPIMTKCVDSFIAEIKDSQGLPVEVNELCGRLSMDCIASCAFGLELNCVKNENKMFINMTREAFKSGVWHNLKSQIRILYPKLFKTLKLGAYKKDVSTFFCSLVYKLIELKKESKKAGVDFVYVLMKLLEEDEVKPEGSPFTIKVGDLIAAQVFSFFVGGYETTSTTMCYALFEIAKDEELQQKIRHEIDTVIGNQEVNYDNVNSLRFLSSVIDEVLRLHNSVYQVQRICSEAYPLPDSNITIEKGMEVIIPIKEIHHDPNNFPEPMKFLPDRFSPANKNNIVKGTYLPFGNGPRRCIGFRFSLLELKLSLAKLIRGFHFTLHPRTPLSLSFEEYSRIYRAKDEIFLIFSKRLKS